MLETFYRHHLTVSAALAAVVVPAWVWLLHGAGMDMSAVEMTAMAGMDGWLMTQAVWSPGYALLMLSMWIVMMTAMMLPSAVPVLHLYANLTRNSQEFSHPLLHSSAFGCGYLATWALFSVAATAAQWGLETARLMSPMLETTNVWLSAGILMSAGIWQFTPLKSACLTHCRSPLGFLLGHWRPGVAGAFNMGAAHGLYCLGCCWFLMALLFFGGIMNLYWIVGLTLFVVAEKLLPASWRLSQLAGAVLVIWGLALPWI